MASRPRAVYLLRAPVADVVVRNRDEGAPSRAPSFGASAAVADTQAEWVCGMLGVVVGRFVGMEHRDDPVCLEDCRIDGAEVGKPLPAGDAAKIGQRDALSTQHPQLRLAFLDQHTGLSFQQRCQPRRAKDTACEEGVQSEEDDRADDRARD